MEARSAPLQRFLTNEPHLCGFGKDAHAIYSLSLYCEIDDLDSIKERHCTDSPNDKSCDYCIIQPENRSITIVQAYYDSKWTKKSAPANKASDLSQAINWLIAMPIEDVPEGLRPYAKDIRDCLSAGDIEVVQLLYVHNCPESDNVEGELRAVSATTEELLKNFSPNAVSVKFDEIGLGKSASLHESYTQVISVRDEILLEGQFVLVAEGDSWRSVQGVLSGEVLSELYRKYESKLFSANVREYLGSRRDARNINYGIRSTAEKEPENFYPFNNGLTLLTNAFETRGDVLVCHGLSIVNGAQTTGALASVPLLNKDVKVLCRVIQCSSDALIAKIVRYNNTQNAVRASDRKSNDSVQKRLELELKELGFSYRRRRGQVVPGAALHIDPVAQCLASFHNELNLAIRDRRDIFEDESKHSKVFAEEITARHVLLVEAFNRAIGQRKSDLGSKARRTRIENEQYEFLVYTAGKQFLLAVLGGILEQLVGHSLPTRFSAKLSVHFANEAHFSEAVSACQGVVETILPFVVKGTRGENYYTIVRSEKRLDSVVQDVEADLEAIASEIEAKLGRFRRVLRDE